MRGMADLPRASLPLLQRRSSICYSPPTTTSTLSPNTNTTSPLLLQPLSSTLFPQTTLKLLAHQLLKPPPHFPKLLYHRKFCLALLDDHQSDILLPQQLLVPYNLLRTNFSSIKYVTILTKWFQFSLRRNHCLHLRQILCICARNLLFASDKCFVRAGEEMQYANGECTKNSSGKFLSNPSSSFLHNIYLWKCNSWEKCFP